MKQINRKLVTLTEDLATQFLSFNSLNSQREIKEARVNNLVKAIKQGLFVGANIAIATNGNGKKYLINGQHCCSAVINSGIPIEITLTNFECIDDEDVSLLFRQFDTGMETRSIAEALNVERDSLQRRWKGYVASLLVAGAIILEQGHGAMIKKWNLNRNDRVELLKKYLKYGDLIEDFIEGSKDRYFKRGPVMAVFIASHMKHPHVAPYFWEEVKEGTGLAKDSSQLKLRDYLLTARLQGASKQKEMFVKCIHAWNAARKGEKTNLAYHPDKPIPKIL